MPVPRYAPALAAATLALAAYGAHRLAALHLVLSLPGKAGVDLSADWRSPGAPTHDYRLSLRLSEHAALDIHAQEEM